MKEHFYPFYGQYKYLGISVACLFALVGYITDIQISSNGFINSTSK